jgi:hypothetical protein
MDAADPRPRPDDVAYSDPPPRGDRAQVVGIVGGPLAVLIGLQANYTLVQVWACKSAAGPVVTHGVSLVSLALAVAAGVIARRQWPAAGREVPGDRGGREGRTRTLAAVGVALSALSALTIVAQWLPQLFLSPCQQ